MPDIEFTHYFARDGKMSNTEYTKLDDFCMDLSCGVAAMALIVGSAASFWNNDFISQTGDVWAGIVQHESVGLTTLACAGFIAMASSAIGGKIGSFLGAADGKICKARSTSLTKPAHRIANWSKKSAYTAAFLFGVGGGIAGGIVGYNLSTQFIRDNPDYGTLPKSRGIGAHPAPVIAFKAGEQRQGRPVLSFRADAIHRALCLT